MALHSQRRYSRRVFCRTVMNDLRGLIVKCTKGRGRECCYLLNNHISYSVGEEPVDVTSTIIMVRLLHMYLHHMMAPCLAEETPFTKCEQS
jgi:hypothetical protein